MESNRRRYCFGGVSKASGLVSLGLFGTTRVCGTSVGPQPFHPTGIMLFSDLSAHHELIVPKDGDAYEVCGATMDVGWFPYTCLIQLRVVIRDLL